MLPRFAESMQGKLVAFPNEKWSDAWVSLIKEGEEEASLVVEQVEPTEGNYSPCSVPALLMQLILPYFRPIPPTCPDIICFNCSIQVDNLSNVTSR